MMGQTPQLSDTQRQESYSMLSASYNKGSKLAYFFLTFMKARQMHTAAESSWTTVKRSSDSLAMDCNLRPAHIRATL